MNVYDFYMMAKDKTIKAGFGWEIRLVEDRHFYNITPVDFYMQYVFVVLNSGMKNQVAEKIFQRFQKDGVKAIGHPGKKKAIQEAYPHIIAWHKKIKELKTTDEVLVFLESLPWIGKITKYHLARNLGFDVAKPDRHMQRLAEAFGYLSVHKMCNAVSHWSGDRIGTVDVILWRYCNLHKNYMEQIKLLE